MNAVTDYETVARAYVNGVRRLLRQPHVPAGQAGTLAPETADLTAEQAERLYAVSADLTRAAEARLADPDPAVRSEAATHLLVKALTDLEISAYLLQAAMEQDTDPAAHGGGLRLYAAGFDDMAPYVKLLVGDGSAPSSGDVRDEAPPTDVPSARVELSNAVADTLIFISERAAASGQAAIGGLLGMGVAEVMRAAAIVGKDIAKALGQAEKVGRLYDAFRRFALESHTSLLVLLGRQLAQRAAQMVLQWLNDLRAGELFGHLLERVYQTVATRQQVNELVAESHAGLQAFLATIDGVDGLNDAFRRQSELAERILRALAFFGSLPMAVLPQPRVFLGSAYIMLGAYVVLCGADYVDAAELRLLDRVPGVRRLAEENLHQASDAGN